MEEGVELKQRDDTRKYHTVYVWLHSQFPAWERAAGAYNFMAKHTADSSPTTAVLVGADAASADDAKFVGSFLEDVAVLSSDEVPMSLSKLKAFVRGSMVH